MSLWMADHVLHGGAYRLGPLMAERIGAPPTIIATGGCCLAGGLWFTREVATPEAMTARRHSLDMLLRAISHSSRVLLVHYARFLDVLLDLLRAMLVFLR